MPSASWIGAPVAAVQARRTGSGSASPALRPWRRPAKPRPRPGRVEHLPVDARRGGEDRGAVRAGERRPDVAVGRAGIDQRGGADRPGVGQPGAERVGPVEGAGVQHPVVGRQPVPAVPHHPPRPGRALGVHDALRLAAGAGGIDDVGRIVRRRRGEGDGRVPAERRDLRRAEHRDAGRRPAAPSPAPSADQLRLEVGEDHADLALGQQRRGRHRHRAERVGGEEEDREVGAVAEPEQHPVAAARARARRARPRCAAPPRPVRRASSARPPRPAPPAPRAPACRASPRRGREGVRGHVERRRAGRERTVVEERWRGQRASSRIPASSPASVIGYIRPPKISAIIATDCE